MHTLEALLPLLDSPEGLEKLRILAAEADGWSRYGKLGQYLLMCHPNTGSALIPPDYPTSLDAIFAAEERLGCHDTTRQEWFVWKDMLNLLCVHYGWPFFCLVSFKPSLRCIAFILTAQYKKK